MKIVKKIINLFNLFNENKKIISEIENLKYQNGCLLLENSLVKKSNDILDHEFKVFSQWGEDGIICYLINNLEIDNNFFVEFGVENYLESNTRFILKKYNWSGLVIDSSPKNISYIKNDKIYWQQDLLALCEFVSKKNINQILSNHIKNKKIGILSIDVDGNDYWIREEINAIDPSIVIIEYNSILGNKNNYVVPYDEKFLRGNAHYSNLYYGASLPALVKLAKKKGYALVACNHAGNNAFFVKNNLLNNHVKEKNVKEAFRERKFRESRDKNNKLNFLDSTQEKEIISKLPLEEV